ncbi:hypothetical protein [Staphylococcus hominis]|uniref:hypothetical protein n=1 Tax=Staphylococcus hominis TaxID=1290 RepID=UPI001889A086|nr:hypothetical protein [Staphylococcus hominis]MBF2307782.1 hypothetical protein [Staphylococcus hominis]MBF2316794.1 hypothetical protein [Staphylococcus hominis]MBF2321080.1 hypothetical protein [Staphylococcus hominis]
MNTNTEIIEEFQKLNLNIPTLSSENKYWYIKEHEKPRYQLDIDKGKIYVKDVSKLEVTHYDKKDYYPEFLRLNKNDILLYSKSNRKDIYILKVNSPMESSEINVSVTKKINMTDINLKLINYIYRCRKNFLDISKYDYIINSIVHSIYVTDNKVVLTIKVTQRDTFKTENLVNLANLPWLINNLINNDDTDLSELRSTISIQSPGFITFKGKGAKVAKILGEVLIISSVISSGGKISIENPYLNYNIELNGTLKEINKAIEENHRHEEAKTEERHRHEEAETEERHRHEEAKIEERHRHEEAKIEERHRHEEKMENIQTINKLINFQREIGMEVDNINKYIYNNNLK